MKVWVVEIEEDNNYSYITGVYFSFEKAKDSVRPMAIETVADWYCGDISSTNKENIKQMFNTFEKDGRIDGLVRITEFEVG